MQVTPVTVIAVYNLFLDQTLMHGHLKPCAHKPWNQITERVPVQKKKMIIITDSTKKIENTKRRELRKLYSSKLPMVRQRSDSPLNN